MEEKYKNKISELEKSTPGIQEEHKNYEDMAIQTEIENKPLPVENSKEIFPEPSEEQKKVSQIQPTAEDFQSKILTTAVCKICFKRKIDSCLSCGHVFCGECLEELFIRNKPCPCCNKPTNQFIHLYYT